MNPAMDHKPAILAVFALTYAGIALGRIPGLKLNRVGIGFLGAVAMMVFAGISPSEAAASVSWPTITLLFGFFVLSSQLSLSGFYDWVAKGVARTVEDPKRFLLLLIPATAGLSAFLNNDIVCYALTPVVGAALLKKRQNPVPYLIALGISSNIGAAATPIGNPQNMLISQVAHLSFPAFMSWNFVPVVVALLATYCIVRVAANGAPPAAAQPVTEVPVPSRPLNRAHAVKGVVILAAVIGLFFTSLPREIVVLVAAGIHLASARYSTEDLLALVDWQILVLFMSLFIVSGAFQSTGYGEDAVRWLQGAGFNPDLPANLALLTAGMTALINNAPAVMLLIKIVPITHASTAYIMAVANSFGGNVILTASVANIIVAQQARKLGITVTFREFVRLGLPITLVSLAGLIGWATLMGP